MRSRTFWVVVILLLLVVTCAAQEKKQVLIPNYVETYEYRFDQPFKMDLYRNDNIPVSSEYTRRSNDIFIIGNFNKVNIIKPQLDVPESNTDNNNYEYVKQATFKPNRTFGEIVKDNNVN